jgi:hypothetical protein
LTWGRATSYSTHDRPQHIGKIKTLFHKELYITHLLPPFNFTIVCRQFPFCCTHLAVVIEWR